LSNTVFFISVRSRLFINRKRTLSYILIEHPKSYFHRSLRIVKFLNHFVANNMAINMGILVAMRSSQVLCLLVLGRGHNCLQSMHLLLWRRFLSEGPNFCTKFDSLSNFSKRRASYHFKAWEFINLQAFAFFNYWRNRPLNQTSSSEI